MMQPLRSFLPALLAVALLSVATAQGADIRFQGAGAAFPVPLFAQWFEKYQKAHPDIKLDYQAVGPGLAFSPSPIAPSI